MANGKVGRPKGSRNLVTLNRTRQFQGHFSEQDIAEWTTEIKRRMKDPETTNTEFVQLFNAVGKLLFVTGKEFTDYELLTEVIVETVSSKEEADALREKLYSMLKSTNTPQD